MAAGAGMGAGLANAISNSGSISIPAKAVSALNVGAVGAGASGIRVKVGTLSAGAMGARVGSRVGTG